MQVKSLDFTLGADKNHLKFLSRNVTLFDLYVKLEITGCYLENILQKQNKIEIKENSTLIYYYSTGETNKQNGGLDQDNRRRERKRRRDLGYVSQQN